MNSTAFRGWASSSAEVGRFWLRTWINSLKWFTRRAGSSRSYGSDFPPVRDQFSQSYDKFLILLHYMF